MMIHTNWRARGRQGRRARLEQRPRGEDRALHRPRRARGRRAPPGRQRALCRADRAGRDQRGERDLPRRGLDPRAPHPHPRRLAGERDPRGRAARDVRARQDRRRRRRRERQGGSRATRRRARAGRPGRDRDPARADAAPLRPRDGAALRGYRARGLVGDRALPRHPASLRLDRHGRPEPRDAGPASVHGRGPGPGPLRRLRDHGSGARLRPAGQGPRRDGGGSARRRRRGGARGAAGAAAAHDPPGLPGLPARHRPSRALRRRNPT